MDKNMSRKAGSASGRKKIISVVGARPNFMKVAPIHKELEKYKDRVEHLICHTGQHYDIKMSEVFFDELDIPKPAFNLGVGSASHADQTANTMIEFAKVLEKEKPDLVLVYGDINGTLAATLVASKLHIKIAHIEAGLRSFDREMPEEVNRIVIDTLADYLFVTEKDALENLNKEGVAPTKIFFTGNVMIDTLVQNMEKVNDSRIVSDLDLESKKYVLTTFHRPENVDSEEKLSKLVEILNELTLNEKVVFSIHPRTKASLDKFKLWDKLNKEIIKLEPLGYIDFVALVKNSKLLITDSGGVQEETTYIKVPCLTLRDSTERPITVEVGTNQLAGESWDNVDKIIKDILSSQTVKGNIPELWDGKAAQRIVKILLEKL